MFRVKLRLKEREREREIHTNSSYKCMDTAESKLGQQRRSDTSDNANPESSL